MSDTGIKLSLTDEMKALPDMWLGGEEVDSDNPGKELTAILREYGFDLPHELTKRSVMVGDVEINHLWMEEGSNRWLMLNFSILIDSHYQNETDTFRAINPDKLDLMRFVAIVTELQENYDRLAQMRKEIQAAADSAFGDGVKVNLVPHDTLTERFTPRTDEIDFSSKVVVDWTCPKCGTQQEDNNLHITEPYCSECETGYTWEKVATHTNHWYHLK